MNTISVVIPVYNRTDTLKDAIESILLQTKKPSEILIIDDGSFFDIHHYLRNYLSFIKIIKLNSNHGVSFARNVGIRECKGDIISFLDSDDIFLPNKLEFQLDFMESNNFFVSHTNEFWYRDNKWINQNNKSKKYGGYIFDKVLDKCRVSPSSLMIKKEIFEKTGLFDEALRVCEDYDIMLRISLFYKIGYLDKKLIIKRAITDNSLSESIKYIESIRLNILKQFYNKYASIIDQNNLIHLKEELKRKQSIVK